MVARSSRILSATVFSVRSSTGPDTARSITLMRGTSSLTIGFSVSSGKVSMASTRFFTSSRTLRTSAPSSTSIRTVPMFSAAVEVTCLIPSMPWIASSIRMHTPSSTSSGAAPR